MRGWGVGGGGRLWGKALGPPYLWEMHTFLQSSHLLLSVGRRKPNQLKSYGPLAVRHRPLRKSSKSLFWQSSNFSSNPQKCLPQDNFITLSPLTPGRETFNDKNLGVCTHTIYICIEGQIGLCVLWLWKCTRMQRNTPQPYLQENKKLSATRKAK